LIPTNRCVVGGNFVKVAIGRDYRDVPPNRGQYTGKASESIEVSVHTSELTAIPAELAAERVVPLDTAAVSPAQHIHREYVNQQVEHQQQQ
jgi:hypothetical protein